MVCHQKHMRNSDANTENSKSITHEEMFRPTKNIQLLYLRWNSAQLDIKNRIRISIAQNDFIKCLDKGTSCSSAVSNSLIQFPIIYCIDHSLWRTRAIHSTRNSYIKCTQNNNNNNNKHAYEVAFCILPYPFCNFIISSTILHVFATILDISVLSACVATSMFTRALKNESSWAQFCYNDGE